ncbi:MAG: fumarylacetoacetate hydrolase family protein [Cyclobacteriaceae bacterium]
MKLYQSPEAILIEHEGKYYQENITDWDQLVNRDDLYAYLIHRMKDLKTIQDPSYFLDSALLPPLGTQEVWASGVTYYRSRDARMEESKAAGGGSFYDRVYEADRPELFFKAPHYRTVGHRDFVRIRHDSNWNVPEPEMTVYATSSGKIVGYTLGNDMSSRDIEGENPLYLPQAKSYRRSAAIGPCLYVSETTLPGETEIKLEVIRDGRLVFAGDTSLSQMKRKFEDLIAYLFRELDFPQGVYLMTGTGIIPANDFSLESGDEIRMHADPIGTLINFVE